MGIIEHDMVITVKDTDAPTSFSIFIRYFSDKEYYFNVISGRSQWTRPKADALEDANKPKEVHCWHILVKHAGSRRPSSWRTEKITRSKEDAENILKGVSATYSSRALS